MELTEILLALGGAGGVVTVLLKHRYDMKKLNLGHKNVYDKLEEDKKNFATELENKIKSNLDYEYSNLHKNKSRHIISNSDVYNSLHYLMFKYGFSRVYVIQPHPKKKNKYLSVSYEVRQEGVTSVIQSYDRLQISKFSSDVKKLNMSDFTHISDIPKQIKDLNTRAKIELNGTTQLFAHRMLDEDNIWCGSIIAEYISTRINLHIYDIQEDMKTETIKIKNIIPDIE